MVADIGHDLNIESKQDTDHYHQKSSSTSVGGSFSWGGTSSVNASTSSTKMNSDWASVTDQSGIYAGKGGFDIKVGNNTDLKGGVIASDAPNSSQNRLDTGSISFSDIENKAKYDVKSSSAGISSSGMPSLPTSRNKKESESSITHSAVSDGTIIIRNESEQKQDIAGLSRDTEHANNELKHIFDKEKEQSIIDQTRLVSEIGGETLTMLNNIDRIKATEEAKKAVEAEKQKSQTPLTEQQEQKIYEDAYKKAMDNGMSAMGSNTRQGIDMAVNIINGLISGDMTGAAAGALAPKIASIIKSQTEHYDPITGERKIDYISNTVCHAILGAVVAELQGNSAIAGGLGAVASERSAEIIAGILYPGKSIDKLSQDEKQQISALAQLATALAVAAGGGDIQDINTAVAGGKNAVENNYLKLSEARRKAELSWIKPNWKGEELTEDEKKELEYFEKKDKERDLVLLETCYAGNISSSACQGLLQEAWQMQNEYAEEAARTLKYSDVYMEDSNNLDNILLGLDRDSVSYWKDIEAISKVSDRPLLEVKKEYIWALIADSVSKSLAAAMGYNANAGKGTTATTGKQEAIIPNNNWGALDNASKTAFDAAKNNVTTWTPKDKHMVGTTANRSAQFNTNNVSDIQNLVKEALNSPNAKFLPNNVDGSFRVVVDMNKPIGTKGQTSIRIIIGNDGKIWNAFPVNSQ